MGWALLPLKRYAEFGGRSRRLEYWMFTLFVTIAIAALVMIGAILSPGDNSGEPSGLFVAIIVVGVLAFVVPGLAVAIRRLHDQDRSGWFYLLFLIPYVGGLIGLVFMCLPGTSGPNRFGPDPKEEISSDI